MKYLFKYRWWMKLYSSNLVWRIPTKEKEVFLTFDDGPSDPITGAVLDLLKSFNAKGTFFCVGKNVSHNPSLFKRIMEEGHVVGNHTQNHINGWKSSVNKYLGDVNRCETIFGTEFFRPPYGKMTMGQIRALKKRFTLVMWTLLSGDFDKTISTDAILEDLKKSVKQGDIIVFHDNPKMSERLLKILPDFLLFLQEQGYSCSPLRKPKKWLS